MSMMRLLRVLIAAGVALALADASVVTLALPEMLVDLDTTVEGVAAVIGVYTLVLAAALPGAAWLHGRISDRTLGVGGFGLFAVAGALCATPDAIGPMLAFRGVQAIGAAGALAAGFAYLRVAADEPAGARRPAVDDRGRLRDGDRPGARRRADPGVRLAGDLPRAGPARARRGRGLPRRARRSAQPAAEPPAPAEPAAGRPGAAVALAAVSAALTGVLFLLVLLLVSGWSLEPLAAALGRLRAAGAAFAGAADPRGCRRPRQRRAARSSAAGVLALAVLPDSTAGWIMAPQVLAGVGMGMALPALAASCCRSARRPRRPGCCDPPCGHHRGPAAARAGRRGAARRRGRGRARARRGADPRRAAAAARQARARRPARRRPRSGRPARRPAPGARRAGGTLRRRSRPARASTRS